MHFVLFLTGKGGHNSYQKQNQTKQAHHISSTDKKKEKQKNLLGLEWVVHVSFLLPSGNTYDLTQDLTWKLRKEEKRQGFQGS